MHAELHDIGKLIDWRMLGLQRTDDDGMPIEKEPHDFEKCMEWNPPIDLESSAWQAIIRKDDIGEEIGKGASIRRKHWPDSMNWLWVSLGDQLAAGWGRALRENLLQGSPRYGHHCLWTGSQQGDHRLKSLDDLDEMISFLNQSPSWEEAEYKYGNLWYKRAECARPGLNVTTLHSHSVVAGKIANVLSSQLSKEISQVSTWPDATRRLNQLTICIAILRVGFYQRPFRVAEWNIFSQRSEALKSVHQRFARNVLGRINNEMICVFASNEECEALAQLIIDKGFWVEIRSKNANVSDMLSHGLMGVLNETWRRFYPLVPPASVRLPICEVCQMSHADKRWPADHLLSLSTNMLDESKRLLRSVPWVDLAIEDFPESDRQLLANWLVDSGEEMLCSRCFQLRRSAQRLTRLPGWRGSPVAWIRPSLNLDRLANALKHLHTEYVKETSPGLDVNVLDKLEVKYPLLVDFFDDYRKALASFNDVLTDAFTEESIEEVNNDLWCVRLVDRNQALGILRCYQEWVNRFFPKLLELSADIPSPLRIAISISPHNYPFFLHLRHLESAEGDVSVQLISSGTSNVPLPYLSDVLRALDDSKRRAIHRLRDIAQTSQALAQLVLRNKSQRHAHTYSQLQELCHHQVDFQSLLILSNLTKEGD